MKANVNKLVSMAQNAEKNNVGSWSSLSEQSVKIKQRKNAVSVFFIFYFGTALAKIFE